MAADSPLSAMADSAGENKRNQQPVQFQTARQFRQPGSAERGPGAGSPAGRQRRKKAAVDYTAAQAVAAALLASAMGNTVTASARRAAIGGAAQIQRIAENAPGWLDVNTFCAALLNMAVEPLRLMSDSEQFRSTPKTVATSIGELEVRQTD
jgi:hypothetical protein